MVEVSLREKGAIVTSMRVFGVRRTRQIAGPHSVLFKLNCGLLEWSVFFPGLASQESLLR